MDTGGYSGDKRFDMVKVPGINILRWVCSCMGFLMLGIPMLIYDRMTIPVCFVYQTTV